MKNAIPCPDHLGHYHPCRRCKAEKRPPTAEELAAIRDAYQAKVRALREERAEIEVRRAGS